MGLASASGRTWKPTGVDGVEICVLHQNETNGGSALLRFRAGARFPKHNHPGGEEVYIVSGKVTIGDQLLQAGDYLWTDANQVHDAKAIEETVFFVSSPRGIEILER